MSTRLRTVEQVADDLQVSAWTVAELVRLKKVQCVRLSTTGSEKGLIRFSDEQVAEIVAQFTVATPVESAPRRRKRRTA